MTLLSLAALAVALPAASQTTCYTNPQGTTICSTPSGVINGDTSATGHSVYRDDRGNLLDFHTDQSGKASVQLPSGERANWSQSVLGEKKYPYSNNTAPAAPPARPATPGIPATPGMPAMPGQLPGQP